MQKRTFRLLCIVILVIGGVVLLLSQQKRFLSPLERRCHQTNLPYQNAHLPKEERIQDLLKRMTEREKIGQLALVERGSLTDTNDIRDYTLGALLSGAGSRPATNTPAEWLKMIRGYQAKAKETCLEIPLLYGIDAIHGDAGMQGATVFPHTIGLAATHDANLVQRIAEATAEEMAASGIYWNFAPNLDVSGDQRWGRVYETFGSNPTTVSTLGLAYLQGLQTSSSGYLHTLGTLKHFVGNGGMIWGTAGNKDYRVDQGDTQLNEQRLRAEHVEPFKKSIKSGALVVMAGLNRWNGGKISANHYLLTDILKEELGFTGFVVSDWYGVYALSEDRYAATVMGINAGVDMVMLPYEYKLFMTDMEQALTKGAISKERLDDAVRRILRAKFSVGLFDRPEAMTEGLSLIGNEAHRIIAREAVQKSLVLLKDNQHTLPLSHSTSHILVAGSAANNLGQQSGAWTIDWQGIEGNAIPGTTILKGIQEAVSSSTRVDFAPSLEFTTTTERADIGIAVVGEKPYAEGVGDNADPRLSVEDVETIKRLRSKSKKLVVVIVSGRSLALPPEAKAWDAIVAAWLPGSEGEGVADVLFGKSSFTGKLPITWKK